MLKQLLAAAAWRLAPGVMVRQHLMRRKAGLEPELWLVPRLLAGRSRAIDVGANRGVWSVQLARSARAVEAFEPNPACVRELRRVVGGRVRIHSVALSDHAGQATLRFDPGNTGVATIERSNTLTQNAGIRRIVEANVPVATLDSFGFDDVGLIKIDVEGHEEAVLRGATQTLRTGRPSLVVETEDRHNPGAPARVEALLRAAGYAALVLHEAELVTTDEARRRNLRLGAPDGLNNFVFVPVERMEALGLQEGARC